MLLKLLKGVFITLTLCMLIGITLSVVINHNYFKRQIGKLVTHYTGDNLIIEGHIGLIYSLTPGIKARGIKLTNAKWGTRPWSVEVSKLSINISLSALLKGQIQIEQINIHGPKLWLEQNNQGQWNIDFVNRGNKHNKSTNSTWPEFGTLKITSGMIGYRHPNRQWDFLLNKASLTSTSGNPTTAQVMGVLEHTTIAAQIETGSLEDILAQRQVPLNISAMVDQSSVSITGRIANLLHWSGVDLAIDINLDTLQSLSNIAGVSLPTTGPVSASANYNQTQGIQSAVLDSIQVKTNWAKIPLLITGQFNSIQKLSDIDLKLNVAHKMSSLVNGTQVILKQPSALQTTVRLTGVGQHVGLFVDEFNWKAAAGSVSINGSIPDIMANWKTGLQLNATIEDLTQFGNLIGYKLPPLKKIHGTANLVRYAESFALDQINISTNDTHLDASAQGVLKLKNPITAHLEVKASAKNGQDIVHLLPWALPKSLLELSHLKLDSIVKLDAGTVSVQVRKLDAQKNQAKLHVNGMIDDLVKVQGIDLQLLLTSVSLKPFLTWLPKSWATKIMAKDVMVKNQETVVLSAKLKKQQKQGLMLDQIKGQIQLPNLLLKARGVIQELGPSMQSHIKLALKADTLESLPIIEPSERWQLNNIQATAMLRSTSATKWRIDDLLVLAGNQQNVKVSGEISQLSPLNLVLAFKSEGLKLGEVYPAQTTLWNKINLNPNQEDRIDASFYLYHNKKQPWSIDKINAEVNTAGFKASISGEIKQPLQLQGFVLNINLNADSLHHLPGIDKNTFKPIGPIQVQLHLSDTEDTPNPNIKFVAGSTRLTGVIRTNRYNEGDGRQKFYADLTSPMLDLDGITKSNSNKQRLFSIEPLHVSWLKNFDLQLQLNIKQFKSSIIEARDAIFSLTLDSGVVKQRFAAKVGAGQLKQMSFFDSRSIPFNAVFDIVGSELSGNKLKLLTSDDVEDSGTVDLSLGLAGSGYSISQILGQSNGHVLVKVNNVSVKNTSMNMFGGDVFLNLLHAIMPTKKKEHIKAECGVLNFAVNNGLMSNKKGIAFKTNKVTLLGGGKINLGSENISILIHPKPRKGVGISATSIAKFVRLGGTITAPKVELDPKGLLGTGAAIGAALATGGTSLLAQGLYDLTRANLDVCKAAANTGKKKLTTESGHTGR